MLYSAVLIALDTMKRPRTCVLCLAGIEGGSNDNSGGLHHIFSRARLSGKRHMQLLWSVLNLAASCSKHHQRYDKNPLMWTTAMEMLGFAEKEDYAPYWDIIKSSRGEG